MRKILCVAAGLLCTASAASAEHIKATVPTANDTAYAMYHVAQDKGYFAAEGLDVEVVEAGGGVATPALISGDAQFTGSPGAAIPAILKGAPLKLVMVTQQHPSYQLWASDPAIRTVADLKGRQLAVNTRGDSQEAAARKALMQDGVDPATVAFTAISFPQARAVALENGSLPAALLTFDDVVLVENAPKVHLLEDLSKTVSMVVGGAVSSDRMLQGNRPLAIRFMRALIKGFRYARANKEATIDILLKHYPTMPRAQLETGYDRVRSTMTDDGTVPDALAQAAIDQNAEVLGIPPEKRRPLAEVVDFSVAREVNKALDAEGWKPMP